MSILVIGWSFTLDAPSRYGLLVLYSKLCIADPNRGTKTAARVKFRELLQKLIVRKSVHRLCFDKPASANVDKEEEKERRKHVSNN